MVTLRRAVMSHEEEDERIRRYRVMLPYVAVGPLRQVTRRLLMALSVLAATILIVYGDNTGYKDNVDGHVSLIDAAYYATVTLSTTGYGDITPVSPAARALAMLQQWIGVMFVAILIARLTGLYGRPLARGNDGRPR